MTVLQTLSSQELSALAANLSKFTTAEQEQIAAIIDELDRRRHAKECRDDLLTFCKHMDPSYVVATHHKKLAELLMQIAYGFKDRIAVSIPPRHGKSHLISTLFPAWFLGKFPDKKVLMVSNKADLAVDFGRKVRNLIADEKYQGVFPGITLAQDSKSAGRWSTNKGGEYFATGVGGAIAGRGADLLLVDDPHDEQDILNGNFEAFEKTYQWFTFGARTRLMSGGRVAIVHCMTGDTPVLMSNGVEKSLCELRPGDIVASYDNGTLVPAKVLNWGSQGFDRVFTIKTTSGKILRANGKHPLLVSFDGEPEWVKVKYLKVGMPLVGVQRSLNAAKKAVISPNMRLASASTTTTKIGGKLKSFLDLVIGGSGKASHAVLKVVMSPLRLEGCAPLTTTNKCGPLALVGVAQTRTVTPISNTDTVLALRSTTKCSQSKVESAQYAVAPQVQITLPLTGKANSGWTTATTKSVFGRYCVTPVTSLLAKVIQKKHSYGLLNTYEPILDQIVEITLDGYEEVFDIQVEGTENFVANGLVSHNTRWHEDDLIGHVVKDGTNNEKADQYEVFEFPAILDTPAGQKALWPEKFDLEALERTKASMPSFQWSAQYMQSPTSEEGALVKREWWMPWKAENPPQCEFVIMALDAAAEKTNRADYTALTTWGVFADDELTKGQSHIILLNAINVRVEFAELKDLAIREWEDWTPDSFIVEKKSNGIPLYQELRRLGIPVQEFTPHRGTGDKVARLNAITDILRSGMVWYPEGRRWAEELIEQSVAFPYGSHDDLVDTMTMALARFRQGGFIALPTDYKDEKFFAPRKAAYY